MLSTLAKPWYIWRPWQLARRASVALKAPRAGYVPLDVAWGVPVIADPVKTIGWSLLTTGIFDLSVSEVLARLINPGDTVVDAGANVGYMSMLASIATGPSGRVIAWEPHPELFSVLQQNAASLSRRGFGAITTRNAALGAQAGRADLIMPAQMDSNDGVSYIGTPVGSASSVPVDVEAIDDVMGGDSIAVMKLDVEGAELGVLAGARHVLGEGRITHIVFEDHLGAGSAVSRLLVAHGYTLFSIGWSVRRLHLSDNASEKLTTHYEAPSYIASLAPDAVIQAASAPGWITLNASFSAGSRLERGLRASA